MWVWLCGRILAPEIKKVFGTKDEPSQVFLNMHCDGIGLDSLCL